MRQFYEAWSDSAIWPSATAKLESGGNALSIEAVKSEQHESVGTIWPSATTKLEAADGVAVTVAEFLSISFSYHMEILSGVKTLEERLFYIHEAAQNKWKERQLRESIKRDDFNHRGGDAEQLCGDHPRRDLGAEDSRHVSRRISSGLREP